MKKKREEDGHGCIHYTVIDSRSISPLASYTPSNVNRSASALRGSLSHYILISSVSFRSRRFGRRSLKRAGTSKPHRVGAGANQRNRARTALDIVFMAKLRWLGGVFGQGREAGMQGARCVRGVATINLCFIGHIPGEPRN